MKPSTKETTPVTVRVGGDARADMLAIHRATGAPLCRLAQEAFEAGRAAVVARYKPLLAQEPPRG